MSQRDEIAEMLFDLHITVSMLTARRITDRLLAAGLLVPPGLTATRLHLIAEGMAESGWAQQSVEEVHGWADWLDTQETQ